MPALRRQFLHTVSTVALTTAIAGCIGSGGSDPDEPDTLEEEPRRTTRPDHLPPEDERPMDAHVWGSGISEEPSLEIIAQGADPIEHEQGISHERIDQEEDRFEAGDDAEHWPRFVFADLLTKEAHLDQLDGLGSWTVNVVDEVNFDEEFVLFAQVWMLSSNRYPVIVRVEEAPYGVHAYGYVVSGGDIPRPRGPPMATVCRCERPATLDGARVTLTEGEEARVHFNTTEGVVEVPHRQFR